MKMRLWRRHQLFYLQNGLVSFSSSPVSNMLLSSLKLLTKFPHDSGRLPLVVEWIGADQRFLYKLHLVLMID